MTRPENNNEPPPESKWLQAEQEMRSGIARGVGDLEREEIIQHLAKKFGFTQKVLNKAWRKLAADHQRQSEQRPPPDRDELYQRCRHIAENPQLLEDMADVADQLGVVEDRQGVKATYLAATSRLAMNRALSHLRRGAAASGKSHPINIVLDLFPAESVIIAVGGSPKSLPYYGGNDVNALKHKIVYIPEAAAIADKHGAETDYTTMLRVLISENRLVYQTVVITEAGPATVTLTKEGPIAVIITSARDNIEDEMMTRLLVSDADESDEQTKAIVRRALTKRGEVPDRQPWVDFQRWLELGGPYEVVIPFLAAIRKAHGKSDRRLPLRYRRDIGSFVTAIEASAIVHSAQRQRDEHNRIIAEMADYGAAFDAFDRDMNNLYEVEHDTDSAGHIPTTLKAVIQAIEKMVEEDKRDRAEQRIKPKYKNQDQMAKVTIDRLMRALGISSRKTAADRLKKARDLRLIELYEPIGGLGQTSPHYYRVLVPSDANNAVELPGNLFPHPDLIREFI